MSGIVCAIRGGPDSQPTIDRSIALAKETGLPIYFLYVVNLDFLMYTSSSRLKTITEEMIEMGEFILTTAQSKAKAEGVEGEGVIRQGNVMEEIINLSNEKTVDYVILGRPRGEPDQDVFTHERLTLLIQHIEEESAAKVILSEG